MVKEKLRKIRIDKGMSQKQLAAALPTDVSNYCRKESGDVRITKQEWEKFAQVLGVSFDEIFEEDSPAISINYENSTIAELRQFQYLSQYSRIYSQKFRRFYKTSEKKISNFGLKSGYYRKRRNSMGLVSDQTPKSAQKPDLIKLQIYQFMKPITNHHPSGDDFFVLKPMDF